jgi:hypothetical protein
MTTKVTVKNENQGAPYADSHACEDVTARRDGITLDGGEHG